MQAHRGHWKKSRFDSGPWWRNKGLSCSGFGTSGSERVERVDSCSEGWARDDVCSLTVRGADESRSESLGATVDM